MELDNETKTNINISSEIEVLNYVYPGPNPREVIARVTIGDAVNSLSGVGGNYTVNVYLDDVVVSPSSTIVVSSGLDSTVVISKSIPIDVGDEVSIRVIGLIGDTSVNTIATLRDATPIVINDVTGDGSVPVDEDYGGTDELAYETAGGAGVADATILVYLTDDYDNGDRGDEFIVAKTTTISGGRWAFALNLDPGDYTLIYYRTGAYGPDRKDITVS